MSITDPCAFSFLVFGYRYECRRVTGCLAATRRKATIVKRGVIWQDRRPCERRPYKPDDKRADGYTGAASQHLSEGSRNPRQQPCGAG
jgi:hypothetical protein